ncbi:hypothetical protein BCV72DRAFT_309849 [Rhizopus microsporus var. microsporus]|uniref:Uncharacterized protein n=1 Tax=Rhizopus microsporus var. microsporus TaxID=86635 RepID=A0A1X0QPF1_RHIZD|nr:hypothetical protein BCV72DRAFT_309849 [Rhizopus microsporus var. microsporus]
MLQHKRSAITKHILDTPTSSPQLSPQLRLVEHQLASIHYLKRTVTQRQQIVCLRPACQFYADLYCPDPITHEAVDNLLSSILSDLTLPTSDQYWLTSPHYLGDLLEGVSRYSKRSSPALTAILTKYCAYYFPIQLEKH